MTTHSNNRTLEDVIDDIQTVLDRVPEPAVRAYTSRWPVIAGQVNLTMAEAARGEGLIGDNALRVMYDNHANHAHFVQSALRLRSARMVASIIIWVYRSYIKRGFRSEYFLRELQAWQASIRHVLSDAESPDSIAEFYRTLANAHSVWLRVSTSSEEHVILGGEAQEFLDALLTNDEMRARDTLRRRTQGASMLPSWWNEVVTPALHRLGELWANGEITVAEEHVATMIARRVLDQAFPRLPHGPHRGVLVAVIVTPGERHDIGARMVADLVRLHGAEVMFTGADVPVESLVQLAKKHDFDAFLMSTTVAMNLGAVGEMVTALRRSLGSQCPTIIVGGAAYEADPGIARRIGADRYVADMREVLSALRLVPEAVRAG